MPDVERHEILVVGSGEAGKYLAWTMAKAKGQAAHSFPSPKTLNTFDECLVEESR